MIWIWAAFVGFVLLLLFLDLGVFHRRAHVVEMKEALGWSAVWILLMPVRFSIPGIPFYLLVAVLVITYEMAVR